MTIASQQFISYCMRYGLLAKVPECSSEWDGVSLIGCEGDIQDPAIFLDSSGDVYVIHHEVNVGDVGGVKKVDEFAFLMCKNVHVACDNCINGMIRRYSDPDRALFELVKCPKCS